MNENQPHADSTRKNHGETGKKDHGKLLSREEKEKKPSLISQALQNQRASSVIHSRLHGNAKHKTTIMFSYRGFFSKRNLKGR
jgi:hypothetical protein